MGRIIKKTKHMVAEEWNPPAKMPKLKKLNCEMAQRQIRALQRFFDDGDIGLEDFLRLKREIIERVVAK
ncbi:MAG: hypothetical protein WBE55_00070 [Candidatus Sulfotelmatobacter sp.]